ncbi:MAG: DUF167 family protein [bacterium]
MYLKLKVKTKAKKEEVIKESPDHFSVSIKEKPEMNRANTRILEIFRDLNPGKSVKIVSGHHSPSKIISID